MRTLTTSSTMTIRNQPLPKLALVSRSSRRVHRGLASPVILRGRKVHARPRPD